MVNSVVSTQLADQVKIGPLLSGVKQDSQVPEKSQGFASRSNQRSTQNHPKLSSWYVTKPLVLPNANL